MNIKTKGYILGAIAAATYGMNPLFTLPLYNDGMNPDSVLFFRYVFAIPMLGFMLKARGRGFTATKKETIEMIIFGLLFSLSSLTLFQSYNYMDAGIASTLLFIYPILVAMIMVFVFKEKITLRTILCITMAIGGIGMLFKSSDGTTLDLTGVMLVFISALSYATYIVGINQSALKNVATLKVTFYVLLYGTSLYIFRVLMNDNLILPTQWYLWFNLIALALFPTAISLLCTTSAILCIGSTPTAILGALEPVTAVFIGVTLFDETVGLRECTGLVLIILAVTIIVAGGKISGPLLRLRKLFPRLPLKRKA